MRALRAAAQNLGLLVATLAVLLLVVELTLRATGFSFVLYPEEIEFGKPEPVLLETGFLEDDDLFWVTRDYPEKLERLARERPRLVLMGDSCTQLGRYDEALAELVAARRGARLSYANLGVAGWSSYQGRRQLERDVLPLAPEAVTIYYGWNDHWIGFGIEDENVARIKAVFSSGWSQLRLVQLFTKTLVALGTRETAYPNRVSLEDFRDNLRAMARQAAGAGVRAILVTAPSAHVEGEEPEYLAERHLRERSELVPLHRAYVEAVREVAAESPAALCDAARAFDELPRAELERSFLADGIHLTEEGDRRLAELLYACLEREGLLGEVEDSTEAGS